MNVKKSPPFSPIKANTARCLYSDSVPLEYHFSKGHSQLCLKPEEWMSGDMCAFCLYRGL